MFATTKDIFYLVLSFCVVWLTAFLCWGLYYLMKILRESSELMEEWHARLRSITGFWGMIKEKIFSVGAKGLADLIATKTKAGIRRKK